MPHSPLSLYLQDHLAGATAGVNLARRCAATGGRGESGRTLTGVASEIEEDRETLVRLMGDLGIRGSAGKNAGAWIAERLARLKPNGRLRGEPSMQRLHELEALSLGIAGKIGLWEALRSAPEVQAIDGLDLTDLELRARSQRERVESERLASARAAFATPAPASG